MSYANFPANVVIRACEGYLQARRDRIERKCEEFVNSLVGTKTWFWSKPLTREQAKQECAEEISLERITGGLWAGKVEDLLSLAKMSKRCNTPVAVNAELASLLENYFD